MSVAHDWERVRAIFQAALEQPAATRHSFVVTACAGDEAIRQEVTSLLAAHVAADGFLETPVVHRGAEPADSDVHLTPGSHVGPFEVIGLLGIGGMGEVYRARDGRLNRDVAVKLLPPTFASDSRRLARFERESRILASLNHPNIASIHSVEQIDGLHLLVLELVEGPTLAECLQRGPRPVADALAIARQLAEALHAAHERGIVHRDLKPANIKLTRSAGIKLLDFGLAKQHVPFDGESFLPHAAGSETSAGVILGTCAYMSPEQARGQTVDKRADIWAFGCILFELLTGARAFAAHTPSDTIAAVLERQPDWRTLPEAAPAAIRTLLQRCLEKDARRRLHDIADARIELEDALDLPAASAATRSRRGPKRGTIAGLTAALVLTVGALGLAWWLPNVWRRTSLASSHMRFTWSVPAGMRLESPPVVAPDGEYIAFTASKDREAPRLYVRPLRALEANAVARTDGAMHPFWSPDSRAVAYFASGKLMKVALDGEAPVEICAVIGMPRGGAWGRGGVIVFSPNSIDFGLLRVSAEGGRPEPATTLDTSQGENSHRWPVFLSDGLHFLYFVRSSVAERRGVYLGRVDRPPPASGTQLFQSENEPLFARLDDSRGSVIMSVANGHIDVRLFEEQRRVVSGAPLTIPLPAAGVTPYHPSMLSVSTGVLTHVSSPIPFGQRLVSSTRKEDLRVQDVESNVVNWPRLSPDGSRIATQRLNAVTGSPELWVQDLDRSTKLRVTPEGTAGLLPVWSPAGSRIAYMSGTILKPVVTIAAADGTGVIATLDCPRLRCEPSDWSRDGRWLSVNAVEGGRSDVWLLPTRPGDKPRPVLTESFAERDARWSPDGRLIAYQSEEGGRPEISVRTFEGTPRREVVSVSGGGQPVWSRDGTALYFVDPGGLLRRAAIRHLADGRVLVNNTVEVDIPPIGANHSGVQYDVASDGRVYFVDRRLPDAPREIGIVLGWQQLLKADSR